jgi:hypothetical protein
MKFFKTFALTLPLKNFKMPLRTVGKNRTRSLGFPLSNDGFLAIYIATIENY